MRQQLYAQYWREVTSSMMHGTETACKRTHCDVKVMKQVRAPCVPRWWTLSTDRVDDGCRHHRRSVTSVVRRGSKRRRPTAPLLQRHYRVKHCASRSATHGRTPPPSSGPRPSTSGTRRRRSVAGNRKHRAPRLTASTAATRQLQHASSLADVRSGRHRGTARYYGIVESIRRFVYIG